MIDEHNARATVSIKKEKNTLEIILYRTTELMCLVMLVTSCAVPQLKLISSSNCRLLDPHPNTYTYTKRLAETLVAREYPNLPCVIARPSIGNYAYPDNRER